MQISPSHWIVTSHTLDVAYLHSETVTLLNFVVNQLAQDVQCATQSEEHGLPYDLCMY